MDAARPGESGSARAILRVALLLAGPVALFLGAALVCPDSTCRPDAFDQAGMAFAARAHGMPADTFFRIVTWAGSILVLGPLALAHALFAWQRLRSCRAFFLPGALVGATLMGYVAKIAVERERPAVDALIAMPADASFPSAHTLQVCAFVLAWLLPPGQNNRSAIAFGLGLLLVGLVAWSRLHLQVHYPSDILVALVAGSLWVLTLRQQSIWSPKP